MSLASKQKSPLMRWINTQASSRQSSAFEDCSAVQWRTALSAIAQSGDVCCKGSWVFVQHSEVKITSRIMLVMLITFSIGKFDSDRTDF
jgi:hypothetical protein